MIKVYFEYTAIDTKGKEVTGLIESKSRKEASNILMTRDYIPIKLKLQIKLNRKIKNQELYIYCQKMSSLLASGIDIDSTMDILEEESDNFKLKLASKNIKEKVLKGELLSESFDNADEFPKILINMIRVGEETGELDLVLKNMSKYFYNRHKIESKIKNTLIYPIVLTSLTILITIFLLIFIVPRFNEIFVSNNLSLPFITRIIIGLSNILINNPLKLLLIPIGIYLVIKIVNLDRYKFTYDKYKIKYSFFKKIRNKINILNILTPLSMMFSSGIPILDILDHTTKIFDNLYIENKLKDIRESLNKGDSISGSFEESKLFTKMITTSIRVGEETGSLDNVLKGLTSYYEDDILNSLDKAVLYLEPSLIIVIGMIIGGITIGLVIPILNLMEGIA